MPIIVPCLLDTLDIMLPHHNATKPNDLHCKKRTWHAHQPMNRAPAAIMTHDQNSTNDCVPLWEHAHLTCAWNNGLPTLGQHADHPKRSQDALHTLSLVMLWSNAGSHRAGVLYDSEYDRNTSRPLWEDHLEAWLLPVLAQDALHSLSLVMLWPAADSHRAGVLYDSEYDRNTSSPVCRTQWGLAHGAKPNQFLC